MWNVRGDFVCARYVFANFNPYSLENCTVMLSKAVEVMAVNLRRYLNAIKKPQPTHNSSELPVVSVVYFFPMGSENIIIIIVI